MSDSENAAEHLRVIRQLMERATVYRAISAPTALGGGLAAIALAAWQHFQGVTWQNFLATWLSLFVLLSLVNLALLWRDARQRSQPFFSSGMKMALRALAPPLFAGGVIGVIITINARDLSQAASLWATFYGLALLAASSFAPPSINKMGCAFVVLGLAAFALQQTTELKSAVSASAIMGLGFGLIHVFYGLAVLGATRGKTP